MPIHVLAIHGDVVTTHYAQVKGQTMTKVFDIMFNNASWGVASIHYVWGDSNRMGGTFTTLMHGYSGLSTVTVSNFEDNMTGQFGDHFQYSNPSTGKFQLAMASNASGSSTDDTINALFTIVCSSRHTNADPVVTLY